MIICICGAGTMGIGIAQVCATASFETLLFDLNAAAVQTAEEKINDNLQKLVAKQKITIEKKTAVMKRLQFISDISLCHANIIIEAIVEKLTAKQMLFKELELINDSKTIFASNTSSLSISDMAKELTHQHRVAGLHFFNPAPLMKLVEVVRGRQTSDDVIKKLVTFTERLGKTTVICKESPGFIVNRVARPFYIEALRLVEEGLTSYETADRLLQNIGFKMGPFKLMDLIGNDINYAVSCSVYEQLNKPERLKPSYLQKEKVDKGELGKKAGKGYYHYS